jgi:hypothetical protein
MNRIIASPQSPPPGFGTVSVYRRIRWDDHCRFRCFERVLVTMPLLADETLRRTPIDAFVKAIRAERDPWRKARLLALVRKRREHEGLREVARELFEREADAQAKDRRCYWAALEILTEPSAEPPKERSLWIEPTSDVCFVRIPAGSGRYYRLHEFWLARHPVTNEEYLRYVSEAGAAAEPGWSDPHFSAGGQPVVGVRWRQAEEGYCGWLRWNVRMEEPGLEFGLPTHQQWEHACRAGSDAAYSFGND